MKVAILCEYSGTVRDSFIKAGCEAISYDILETEVPGPHVVGDVRKMPMEYWRQFDLIIAHPPCTYLSYAGNHVWNEPGREEKRIEAMEFFYWCVNLPVKYICIENPVGYANVKYRKPDQIIHPYFFGEKEMKRTCLWLKNLPLLKKNNEIIKPLPKYIRKDGKKVYFTESVTKNRSHVRSKTFKSIADSMAREWAHIDKMPGVQLQMFY